MIRPEARDTIRVAAEIPGEEVFNHLINLYIDRELANFTAFRRYVEAQVTREKCTLWAFSTEHGQYAYLPALQHIDEDEIYFAEDDDLTRLRRLRPYNRTFQNITGGLPLFFRIGTKTTGPTDSKVLFVYPQKDLVTATDFCYINYWKILVWDETHQFPIPKLEIPILHKVIEKIASLQKSGIAKKHAMIAQEAYIKSRGSNI